MSIPPLQSRGSRLGFAFAWVPVDTSLARAIRTPTFVSVVLAVVLAADAGSLIHRIVSLLTQKPVDVVSVGRPGVRPPALPSFADIAGAHLFGAVQASDEPVGGVGPVSRAPLVLAGTIALLDPAEGFAIIGSDAKSARTRAVGSSVADGVVLREIYTDHVLVDRGGRLETVSMPHSSLLSDLAPRVAMTPDVATPRSESPLPADIRERLDYENTRVGTALVETPLMSGGVFRGLVVQAGPDPSILASMGLKPDDVIQGVDGILVDLEQVGLLRKALAGNRKVHLNVMRPKEGPVDLDLDPAQFQGLVSN